MVKWDGVQEHIGEIAALKLQADNSEAQRVLEQLYRYVLPIMKKRRYRVHKLVEFLPKQESLLGLNVNHGQRICVRLRYHHDHASFLPFESVLGTMLHELCHNTYGPHDDKFFKLLGELQTEMEDLLALGFRGDPFIGTGRTIGRAPLRHRPLRGANGTATPGSVAPGGDDGCRLLPRLGRGSGRVGKGQKLGGNVKVNRKIPVRLLALEAAERRREADRVCKTSATLESLPPDEQGEVIDLTHDDADDELGTAAGAPLKSDEVIYILD